MVVFSGSEELCGHTGSGTVEAFGSDVKQRSGVDSEEGDCMSRAGRQMNTQERACRAKRFILLGTLQRRSGHAERLQLRCIRFEVRYVQMAPHSMATGGGSATEPVLTEKITGGMRYEGHGARA